MSISRKAGRLDATAHPASAVQTPAAAHYPVFAECTRDAARRLLPAFAVCMQAERPWPRAAEQFVGAVAGPGQQARHSALPPEPLVRAESS